MVEESRAGHSKTTLKTPFPPQPPILFISLTNIHFRFIQSSILTSQPRSLEERTIISLVLYVSLSNMLPISLLPAILLF